MRALLLTLLLTTCTTGDWADYNYGPNEWMADNWGVSGQSIHEDYYEWLQDPVITVIEVDEGLAEYCGKAVYYGSQGCEVGNSEKSTIYVSSRANPATLAHEKKHSRGWCHHNPPYDRFWSMSDSERERHLRLARGGWFPCEG